MSVAEIVSRTRTGVGLFDMRHRGLLEVRGGDRVRWLDGMISGDVEALEAGPSGSGCHAMLLTNRGAIIADLHVARLGDVYLLESLGSAIERIRETLDRFIIADDVELMDRSDAYCALGLEGPLAREIIGRVASGPAGTLAAMDWCESEIAGRPVLIAAFGFSGEDGFQLRLDPADRGAVEAAIAEATDAPLARGDLEALEVLRIEAGIPALGSELDDTVLPPEARLEATIATNKGCYVGQEIVARLRARGQVNHLLVGLRFESDARPEVDAKLFFEGRATGEITSLADSPSAGVIGLGYVRREHSEPGTRLDLEAGQASVVALPFLGNGSADGVA